MPPSEGPFPEVRATASLTPVPRPSASPHSIENQFLLPDPSPTSCPVPFRKQVPKKSPHQGIPSGESLGQSPSRFKVSHPRSKNPDGASSVNPGPLKTPPQIPLRGIKSHNTPLAGGNHGPQFPRTPLSTLGPLVPPQVLFQESKRRPLPKKVIPEN